MEGREVLALPASGAGAGQGATEQEASPAQLLSAAVSVSARTSALDARRERRPPVCQQGTSIRPQLADRRALLRRERGADELLGAAPPAPPAPCARAGAAALTGLQLPTSGHGNRVTAGTRDL